MIIYLIAAAHIFALVLSLVAAYSFINYIVRTNMLRESIEKIYAGINSLSGSREEIAAELKALYGSMGKRGFIAHVQDNLEYSGMTLRFNWMTPELYIVIMTVLSAVVSAGISILTGRWYAGVAAVMAMLGITEYLFARIRDYRYRREEEQLLAMVNCIENCAAESDDIIYILEKTGDMVEGPIHDELLRAVTQVRSGVPGGMAIGGLENRIEHEFFRTLMRNLEISSRNNANYREITAQCRGLLAGQLDNSRRLDEIYREAKIRLTAILAGAAACLVIMSQAILDTGIYGLFNMLTESVIGNLLIAATCASFTFIVYFAFIKGKRGMR